jgi:hypothetical protein
MGNKEKSLYGVCIEFRNAILGLRDAVVEGLGVRALMNRMVAGSNKSNPFPSDYDRAKEILSIASLTNRGIISSIGIYAEVYNNAPTEAPSLTAKECEALSMVTQFSYTEIKAVFYAHKLGGMLWKSYTK